MSPDPAGVDAALLDRALRAARDTRSLAVEAGIRHRAAGAFSAQFPGESAVIVADRRTFEAAGRDVLDGFRRDGVAAVDPILLKDDVYAGIEDAEDLQAALAPIPAIPVAVGSGTINDLTKLAAHRLGRPYMAVATAASMDGYTAYGASITAKGSKQTFDCPAPRAVLADLEVIARAPRGMNASGYADLLAKNVAGADWIVADAAGEEAIDPGAWETVQGRLRSWVGSPRGVAAGDPDSLLGLVNGLMMSGFAMQAVQTSRPASGAEHQFSHLWDMQHHTHEGAAPSHGFKVGVGTLASLALYDGLLRIDPSRIDIDRAAAIWPTLDAVEARIGELHGDGELAEKARIEMAAKHPTREALRDQLGRIRAGWPEMRERLKQHLIPFDEARAMLREAGCPTTPEAIGIGRQRLRDAYEQAYTIRRRFTGLDLAMRLGVFDEIVGKAFGPEGPWGDWEARS
ncbi:sn-glycerol-1-phosphate dehydrogenase [Tundrisphaera sp. TA3]|uniref:sn-glycerol-1-phosphate dehydrogenase n=1 Tax=Tundrisphaera sp. TA3 TaxID=3435775 RepID=UPI003EB95ECC